MENQLSVPPDAPSRRLPLFWIGSAFFVLGPVIYFVQMQFNLLVVPWHLPALATLGVMCMAGSAWQRRGVARYVGLTVFLLLCGLEWFFIGVVTKTPFYKGPAQVGTKLPTFAANFADGKAFTNQSLADGNRTVVVFFRGQW